MRRHHHGSDKLRMFEIAFPADFYHYVIRLDVPREERPHHRAIRASARAVAAGAGKEQAIMLSQPNGMANRVEVDRLLAGLYAARVRGDLAAVCRIFADDAKFQIAGPSHGTPVSVSAVGVVEFRPLLAVMIKTFKLSEHRILSMIIDGAKAAVHWRANVYSTITGQRVVTELVDVVEIRDGRIASFIEFFAPR
jgi:ketosteroid isomerase-like protein